MTTPIMKAYSQGVVSLDKAKHWLMVMVSVGLVVIYVAALAGWLRPLSDLTLVGRLEPLIFVLIGYYFGQIPANQERKARKKEIERTLEKLEATQAAKELVQRERDALSEKVHNARIALDRVTSHECKDISHSNSHIPHVNGTVVDLNGTKLSERSSEIVRKILDS